MNLLEKVKAVEEVFELLDIEIASFQESSGLSCKPGCGKCCFKSDIEATILEFLPFALHLHAHNQTFQWLDQIKTLEATLCSILDPRPSGVGMCTQYKHRGLICRLFGYSARTNKYGKKELITCALIKEESAVNFKLAVEKIANGGEVPVMNHHYMRLRNIDFDLTREFFPINEAIKRAIEVILHYYAYRT